MSGSIANTRVDRHRVIAEMQPEMLKADLRKAEKAHREAIGRSVTAARGMLGWTLDRLAREVGRDARQVSRWERGDDRDRAQVDALWAVKAFRGPWIAALAREANDTAIVVRTSI